MKPLNVTKWINTTAQMLYGICMLSRLIGINLKKKESAEKVTKEHLMA